MNNLSNRNYQHWVRIPNRGNFVLDYLIENIKNALVEKGNFLPKLYSELHTDPSHAHCEICWATIADYSLEEGENRGYYSNDTWVCQQCYSMFIEPKDFMKNAALLQKVDKSQS